MFNNKMLPGGGKVKNRPMPKSRQIRLGKKPTIINGEPIMQIQPVPMRPQPVLMRPRSNAGITGPGGKSVNKIYNTY
jgi:hypothetical protein